jgi:hypothetical protein
MKTFLFGRRDESQSLLAIVAPSQELINRGLFQAVYEIRRKGHKEN